MPLIFLCLGAACALWHLLQIAMGRPAQGHWRRSLAKTAATLGLVASAAASDAPDLVVAGLALGAVGDFFLSRPGQPMFLAGMAAFATGHLAYVAAFWALAQSLGVHSPDMAQGLGLFFLGLAVLGLGTWLAAQAGPLRLPVLAYALIIGAMAATALILPGHSGRGIIQTGVVLFLTSDTFLALRLFVLRTGPARRSLDLLVWPSYWLGQALIAAGTLAYWAATQG